jgi:hypothetical protein
LNEEEHSHRSEDLIEIEDDKFDDSSKNESFSDSCLSDEVET